MKRLIFTLSLILLTQITWAEEMKTTVQLEADFKNIQKSIDTTKQKIKEVRDVAFLPDLYFLLAEFYVEKSRYEYTITRQKNLNVPVSELDFLDSKKSKKQAIDI